MIQVKCDNLAEKEQQLCDVIGRLEGEKEELIKKQNELVTERDNLLTRCEEFTQTIYEYDVEKITMAGKMEEMQNKLEVYCPFHRINRFLASNISPFEYFNVIHIPNHFCYRSLFPIV